MNCISKPDLNSFISEMQETTPKCWIGCLVETQKNNLFTSVKTFVVVSGIVAVAPGISVAIFYKHEVDSWMAGMGDGKEQERLDAKKAETLETLKNAGMVVYEGLLSSHVIKSN